MENLSHINTLYGCYMGGCIAIGYYTGDNL